MSSASSPELVSPSVLPPLELETLREGDQGSSVVQLQAQLSSLEFYQGELSGEFDISTKQALEAFQTHYGVTNELGIFGPQTWYALTFWSQETDWPIPAILPAIKRSIESLVDVAGRQPEPLWPNQVRPQREINSGEILFWPPFRRNHRGTAQ
ncbi:MAG: peptidoglycan-binding domain-containing protein [Cyanobacteria bacterium P01_C01_bin.69]